MSTPVLSNIIFQSPTTQLLVGIDSEAPPEQPVVLSASISQWNITYNAQGPEYPNVDLFTIGDFSASGLSSLTPPQSVVALGPGPRAVYWYVIPAAGAPEGYSTIAWDHDHTQVWTVANPGDPNSAIVLNTISEGNKNQWFKLVNA